MARSLSSVAQQNTESGTESNINLHNFDSLSSPDGDYSYRDHAGLPSAPSSPTGKCLPASNDPYYRELGGFRKYDVDLGDSSDEDGDSDSRSNASANAREHSSEGVSTGTLFPFQKHLNPLRNEKSSSLDLGYVPPAGGIGKGSRSTALCPSRAMPHTLAHGSTGPLSGAVPSGGIGKSSSPPPFQVVGDPADLTAAGMAELDLSVDVPALEPVPAAYVVCTSLSLVSPHV